MDYIGVRVSTSDTVTSGEYIAAYTDKATLKADTTYIFQWKQKSLYGKNIMQVYLYKVDEGTSDVIGNNINIKNFELLDANTYRAYVKFTAPYTGEFQFGIGFYATGNEAVKTPMFDIFEVCCQKGEILQDYNSSNIEFQEFVQRCETYFQQNDDRFLLTAKKDDIHSTIRQTPEDIMFGFNGISDVVKIDKNGMTLRGILEASIDSETYARLEPIEKNGEIQFRMTLVGKGIDSNFNVIDGTGKELFRVGHGGVGLHNNVTFATDQTGSYNGKCYWENGTYYPADDGKNIIGKNINAFYKVFGYKFGLDRNGSERYADFEGPIFRLISSWGYGGICGDMNGYFFPEQTNGWSFGKSDKRISTVYCTNINQPSDLRLKENVKYLLRDEEQPLSLNSKDNNEIITTQDCYDFVKNDLKLAQFNYKLSEGKENEKIKTIGFIAQDIEDTKMGNILLSKDENNILSYDNATYTGILASALQKAIDKIETLEGIINKLQS